jgi:hypothetical protein
MTEPIMHETAHSAHACANRRARTKLGGFRFSQKGRK